jgi:hypothetical protein
MIDRVPSLRAQRGISATAWVWSFWALLGLAWARAALGAMIDSVTPAHDQARYQFHKMLPENPDFERQP